ncbi:hypothetical protein ASA1KI_18090 [Opitutales bacterium ASA1]|uniref:hypothetical protein n=1 Tax=Congregicoccus parvus TaxID=3081749 RepID=UPI002B2851B7|nr:hypothetical protein ASA1KI_18090 [Opitutales bacterium ASA1]
MTLSLFRSGLIPRLVGAIGFATAAFGMVAALRDPAGAEGPPPPPSTAAPHAASAASPEPNRAETITLEIESVRPVDAWSVRLDGETPAGARAESHLWTATLAVRATLLVADLDTDSGNANAVRVRLRNDRSSAERLVWLTPSTGLVVKLDELRAQLDAAAPRGPATPR